MSTYPYEDVVDEMTLQIANGELKENQRLPSIAELARAKDISRSTADRVYGFLAYGKLVYGHKGKGRYVAPGAQKRAQERLAEEAQGVDKDGGN